MSADATGTAAAGSTTAERLQDPVEVPTLPPAVAAPVASPASAIPKPPPAPVPSPPPARGWAPERGSLRTTLVFAALAVAGALLVLYAWDLPPFSGAVQVTDNANVRGQTTVLSPQVSGYITAVLVQDYEAVQQGQLLVQVDDRIYRQRVAQAQANLSAQQASLDNFAQSRRSSAASVQVQAAAVQNAQAQLARAQADMRRVDELVGERSISLRERDQTLASLRQAEAAVLQAEAQRAIAVEQTRTVRVGRAGLEAAVDNARAALRLAEIDLANTAIRAPRDGRLGEVGVRQGQYVTAGTQLLFLVPSALWVVANYKEAQTARIQPGQPAWVTVDALGGARLNGHVERLSPGTGNEFAVIKPDNATGNFVKVSQRVAVRIVLDPGQPLLDRLRAGLSVVAAIDTTGASPNAASDPPASAASAASSAVPITASEPVR